MALKLSVSVFIYIYSKYNNISIGFQAPETAQASTTPRYR